MALEGHPPPQPLEDDISQPSSSKKALLGSAFDSDRFVEQGSRRRSCALVPNVSLAS